MLSLEWNFLCLCFLKFSHSRSLGFYLERCATTYYSGKVMILKGIMPSTLGVFYASILILLKPRLFSSAQRVTLTFINMFWTKITNALNRYTDTLKACALDVDVSLMIGGDMAYIGEKGVNLSGGQRARLALARCLYFERFMPWLLL